MYAGMKIVGAIVVTTFFGLIGYAISGNNLIFGGASAMVGAVIVGIMSRGK